MSSMKHPLAGKWLSDAATAEYFDVCVRTIIRWERDPRLDFPAAFYLGPRCKRRSGDQIVAYVQRRIADAEDETARSSTDD